MTTTKTHRNDNILIITKPPDRDMTIARSHDKTVSQVGHVYKKLRNPPRKKVFSDN